MDSRETTPTSPHVDAVSVGDDMHRRRARWAGVAAAGAGVLVFLWASLGFWCIWQILTNDPYMGYEEIGAAWASSFLAILGVVLLAGGLAFRRFREWGRRAIVAVIVVGLVCVLIWTFCIPPGILSAGGGGLGSALLLTGTLIACLLWLALRYFRSPEIRSLCAQRRPKVAAEEE